MSEEQEVIRVNGERLASVIALLIVLAFAVGVLVGLALAGTSDRQAEAEPPEQSVVSCAPWRLSTCWL